jgi:hypothetical protein
MQLDAGASTMMVGVEQLDATTMLGVLRQLDAGYFRRTSSDYPTDGERSLSSEGFGWAVRRDRNGEARLVDNVESFDAVLVLDDCIHQPLLKSLLPRSLYLPQDMLISLALAHQHPSCSHSQLLTLARSSRY